MWLMATLFDHTDDGALERRGQLLVLISPPEPQLWPLDLFRRNMPRSTTSLNQKALFENKLHVYIFLFLHLSLVTDAI